MKLQRKAHLQQFIHRSTLFNVELETPIHEADKRTRPLRGGQGRRILHEHSLHHHRRSAICIRVLGLRQLYQRDAQRPNVALQLRFPVVHLGRHVPRCATRGRTNGVRVVQLRCESKVAQFNEARFRNKQIGRFDVLRAYTTCDRLRDERCFANGGIAIQ